MRGGDSREPEPPLARPLVVARFDLARTRPQPAPRALAIAACVAIAGSLAANAALVGIGTKVFPSTAGFVHFRFWDYATLTAIGVIAAAAAWPITNRVSSAPRWLFLRMAVLVTITLWIPDVWLLVKGEPTEGVAVLALMHLAVAVITYNALVRLAPAVSSQDGAQELATRRSAWLALLALVLVEAALGVASLAVIPFDRPSGWLPPRGQPLFALHSVVGAALAAGGLVMLASAKGHRAPFAAAVIGMTGVALGGIGGLLTAAHGLRVLGIAIMLLGALIAMLGYLMPAIGSAAQPPSPPENH